MKNIRFSAPVLLLVTLISGTALAQENADAAAQANNPLANMTAFNLPAVKNGPLVSPMFYSMRDQKSSSGDAC